MNLVTGEITALIILLLKPSVRGSKVWVVFICLSTVRAFLKFVRRGGNQFKYPCMGNSESQQPEGGERRAEVASSSEMRTCYYEILEVERSISTSSEDIKK